MVPFLSSEHRHLPAHTKKRVKEKKSPFTYCTPPLVRRPPFGLLVRSTCNTLVGVQGRRMAWHGIQHYVLVPYHTSYTAITRCQKRSCEYTYSGIPRMKCLLIPIKIKNHLTHDPFQRHQKTTRPPRGIFHHFPLTLTKYSFFCKAARSSGMNVASFFISWSPLPLFAVIHRGSPRACHNRHTQENASTFQPVPHLANRA